MSDSTKQANVPQEDSQIIQERLEAVETALQLLIGNILNLRTELLVIKAEIMKDRKDQ